MWSKDPRIHAGPVLYFVCYIALSVTFIYSSFTQCSLRFHAGSVLYFVCYIALSLVSMTFIYSCFKQCGPRIHGSTLAQCWTLSATLHCQWRSSTPVLNNVVQGSRIHAGPVLNFACYIALSVTFIYSCFKQCGPRIHGSTLAQCWTLSATLHCQWRLSTPVLNNVVQGSTDPRWPSAELCLLHCTVSDVHLLLF